MTKPDPTRARKCKARARPKFNFLIGPRPDPTRARRCKARARPSPKISGPFRPYHLPSCYAMPRQENSKTTLCGRSSIVCSTSSNTLFPIINNINLREKSQVQLRQTALPGKLVWLYIFHYHCISVSVDETMMMVNGRHSPSLIMGLKQSRGPEKSAKDVHT